MKTTATPEQIAAIVQSADEYRRFLAWLADALEGPNGSDYALRQAGAQAIRSILEASQCKTI